ncbi:MAG: hypothetical protein IPP17_22295 [Bacteroidetes bacterium]|nr:hypothetical protein [Bacteroidota bacterium]
MDAAHIHLLINHLPVFGSILGAMVLVHGLYAKSDATKIAAYNIFTLSSIGAVIAYFTGEGAEEAVEGLPGVLESRTEAHEDFAMFALVTLILLGVASLVANYLTLRKPKLTKSTAIVVLLISLVSFGLVARTGPAGGQQHAESGRGYRW